MKTTLEDEEEIFFLGEAESISDTELLSLFNTCLYSKNGNVAYAACNSLVRHKERSILYLDTLLSNSDNTIIQNVLDQILSQVGNWAVPLSPAIAAYLNHSDSDIRSLAVLISSKLTNSPVEFSLYLCAIAASEPIFRFVAMSALSNISPVPLQCKPELIKILQSNLADKDFCHMVRNRLKEVE